jgi:hypothetical protein
MPAPPTDSRMPSTAGDSKLKTIGTNNTFRDENERLTPAKKIKRANNPGRFLMYDHPNAASRKNEPFPA